MEPRIDCFKTSVYFTDADGVEWEVHDASRRREWVKVGSNYEPRGPGKRWWREHAGSELAERRYFVRYSPIDGANRRRALEIRRYRFQPGESRWFDADRWLHQLNAADVRPMMDIDKHF